MGLELHGKDSGNLSLLLTGLGPGPGPGPGPQVS